MCARYYIDEGLYDYIEPVAGLISEENRYVGDIRPSDKPLVVVGENSRPEAVFDIAWGYPGVNGKGLLINARAETITKKHIFRNGIVKQRCLLPASSFYEWDSEKNKVTFYAENRKTIFLAGCYDVFQGERRFVIITTEANDSITGVHDRMPLMVAEDELEAWLLLDRYHDLLKAEMPVLEQYREYEQLRFTI